MSQQPPVEYITPFKLARQEQCLKGVVALREMARLGQYLISNEGEASFEILFGVDEGRTYFARGQASASLQMECQRCSKSMNVDVEAEIAIAFVTSDQQAERVSADYEPCMVEDEKLSLVSLIEDELILALPIVATHEDTGCQSWFGENEEPASLAEPRENPFAVLATLKKASDK